MKLYVNLAEYLSQRIINGFYEVGERLPSLRVLSNEHGVSLTTVQQAYRKLEREGMIVPRPQSGYFVKNVKKLDKVTSTAPNYTINTRNKSHSISFTYYMESSGLLLGTGYPYTRAPSLKLLFNLINRLGRQYSQYQRTHHDAQGSPILRKSLVHWFLDTDLRFDYNDVIITAGCQEALFITLKAICKSGDVIAIESPCYFGIIKLLELIGITAIEIPTDPTTGISIEDLNLALEKWPIKALYVAPNCNNPLGYIMPDARKRQLLNLASQYDITILEDDLYSDLSYRLPRPQPLKAWDEDDRVILCSSFSKTLTPEIMTGWIFPTHRYKEKILEVKLMTSGAPALIPQLACAEFITQGHFTAHLRKMRKLYQKNLQKLTDLVTEFFPEGTEMTKPQGAFNLWITLPEPIDTYALLEDLEKEKLKILPGTIFSSQGRFNASIRMSYSALHLCNIEVLIPLLAKIISKNLVEK